MPYAKFDPAFSITLPNEIILQIFKYMCEPPMYRFPFADSSDFAREITAYTNRKICCNLMQVNRLAYQTILPYLWHMVSYLDPLPGTAQWPGGAISYEHLLNGRALNGTLANRRFDLALSRIPTSNLSIPYIRVGCYVRVLNLAGCPRICLKGWIRTIKVLPHLKEIFMPLLDHPDILPQHHPFRHFCASMSLDIVNLVRGMEVLRFGKTLHVLELFHSIRCLRFECAVGRASFGERAALMNNYLLYCIKKWKVVKSVVFEDGWDRSLVEFLNGLPEACPSLQEFIYHERKNDNIDELDTASRFTRIAEGLCSLPKLRWVRYTSEIEAAPDAAGTMNSLFFQIPNIESLDVQCNLVSPALFDQYPTRSLQHVSFYLHPDISQVTINALRQNSYREIHLQSRAEIELFWQIALIEYGNGRTWESEYRMGLERYLPGGPFLYDVWMNVQRRIHTPSDLPISLEHTCSVGSFDLAELSDLEQDVKLV